MSMSDRRVHVGRLAIYLEPRDAWIGAYVAPDAIYVCLLPFLVLRWTRRAVNRRVVNLDRGRLPPVARYGCTASNSGAPSWTPACWAASRRWAHVPGPVHVRPAPGCNAPHLVWGQRGLAPLIAVAPAQPHDLTDDGRRWAENWGPLTRASASCGGVLACLCRLRPVRPAPWPQLNLLDLFDVVGAGYGAP